jgi:hypothetical protein
MVNRQISQGKKDKFYNFLEKFPWQKSNKNSTNLEKRKNLLTFFYSLLNLLTRKKEEFFAFYDNSP